MQVKFEVAGEPHGKGRPQFSVHNGRVSTRTPIGTAIYENFVKLAYRDQCGNQKFDEGAALHITIVAFYSIPKSVSNKKRDQMARFVLRPTKKPDADNVVKIICDSLNKIAYYDDAQIVDVYFHKYYSENPRTLVVIDDTIEMDYID